MMDFATADLCDAHGDRIQVGAPMFHDFGARRRFAGPIRTVRCFEDNSQVRAALSEIGNGQLLVVDAGGSLRCAMFGDQLAALAQRNGWAGIILYGCIRDSAVIAETDIGVKALACHPRRSEKRGEGTRDVPVHFAGLRFEPGHWAYCDADGVVVSADALPPSLED